MALLDPLQRSRRLQIGSLLLLVLLLVLPVLLQGVEPASPEITYPLAFLAGLLPGLLYAQTLQLLYNRPVFVTFWKGFVLSLGVVTLSAVCGLVVSRYFKFNMLFMTYVCSFCVPYLSYSLFHFFLNIPAGVFKYWYYPIDEPMPDLNLIDLSQIEIVQFVFNKKPGDASKTNFTSKAPLQMTLGNLFFIFINDYNEKNSLHTIDYLSAPGRPFGWLFFRQPNWLGKKHVFDPELSFKDNGVKPNQLIYLEREPMERLPLQT